jgi:hypothetical protein
MKTKIKLILKVLAYVLVVVLLVLGGASIFRNGQINLAPDSNNDELTKLGTTASTTDQALLTRIKNSEIILPVTGNEVGEKITLNNGLYNSGKRGSVRQITLGDVQDGKENAVAFAYLLHFTINATSSESGDLQFVDSVRIGAFASVFDMKTIDINDPQTNSEYSVVLGVYPYTALKAALPQHFAVTMIGGKLSADTEEID